MYSTQSLSCNFPIGEKVMYAFYIKMEKSCTYASEPEIRGVTPVSTCRTRQTCCSILQRSLAHALAFNVGLSNYFYQLVCYAIGNFIAGTSMRTSASRIEEKCTEEQSYPKFNCAHEPFFFCYIQFLPCIG